MTESNPLATPRRAALAFIFVAVVLDMLAMGIVMPVLPQLVKEFEGFGGVAMMRDGGTQRVDGGPP